MKPSYEFKKFCLVFLMGILIFSLSGCSSSDNDSQVQGYPIDSDVQTTDQRMLSFSMDFTPDTTRLSQVSQYDAWGYGVWTFGAPLPVESRTDSATFGIMPAWLCRSGASSQSKTSEFLYHKRYPYHRQGSAKPD